ncbi:hypothetical protein NBRC111894_412 [Sporolactobacillus inulinus]|uniref:Uncharacterized protein n=1 Tax=Sporolactobacillus inulinus TaxID=2078 RepID=A0A4Y1Z7F2_9BACL|nr:hypothetical protein NBRC111894_412 [Sporolactobacillus inulinus]
MNASFFRIINNHHYTSGKRTYDVLLYSLYVKRNAHHD